MHVPDKAPQHQIDKDQPLARLSTSLFLENGVLFLFVTLCLCLYLCVRGLDHRSYLLNLVHYCLHNLHSCSYKYLFHLMYSLIKKPHFLYLLWGSRIPSCCPSFPFQELLRLLLPTLGSVVFPHTAAFPSTRPFKRALKSMSISVTAS